MRSPTLTSSFRNYKSLTSKTTRPFLSNQFKMTGQPSTTAAASTNAQSNTPSFTDLGIENTNITTAPGVNLTPAQGVIVGSVLDLFAGRPSLKKLGLWKDDAKFADPLTKSEGRKQYQAQWYGLQQAFSEIERLSHTVTSAGNPITMDLKTRYKIKGIGTEQVIDSTVKIYTDASAADAPGKITEVQDRWNNEIPDGPFAKVFRNLNSVVVPAFVSVPKNEEEDAKKGN